VPSLVQTCRLEQAAEEHFVGGKVGTGLEDRLASVFGAWASWDVLPGEAHTAFCWDLDRGGDVGVGGAVMDISLRVVRRMIVVTQILLAGL